MTYHYDDDIDSEPQQKRERSWPAAAIFVGLVTIGAASAFLWRNYGDHLAAFSSFAFSKDSSAAPPNPADTTVTAKEFQAFQLQIAAQLQAAAQRLADEQALTKRLSDQVAALSAKIDALQRPASPAQASQTAVAPPVAQPAKKRPSPKPAGRISTEGKPLAPPIQLVH